MLRVAIAGGHGGVGRTIVEVLNDSSEHEALILSRKVVIITCLVFLGASLLTRLSSLMARVARPFKSIMEALTVWLLC